MTTREQRDGYKRIAYVFQGGGALGAFQVGAYQSLFEHNYHPDWLCGVSIGSINAAIIAGNPPEDRLLKLKLFWQKISLDTGMLEWFYDFHLPKWHNHYSSQLSVMLGIDGFFKPKAISPWLIQSDTPDRISFYDTSPLYDTLCELIDFEYLNHGKIRLSLGAVDVANGRLLYFDNKRMQIGPEHVMASGALPPGFPAVKINGKYFWDGGVHSNTPLSLVLDDIPEMDTLVFMIDNFSAAGVAPHSLDGVLERAKDIRYASHSQRHTQLHMTRHNLRRAISILEDKLTPEQKADPEVQEILHLGCTTAIHIAHVIYKSPTGTELHSKDYEFSKHSIDRRMQDGYDCTNNLIYNQQARWIADCKKQGISVYMFDEENLYAYDAGGS